MWSSNKVKSFARPEVNIILKVANIRLRFVYLFFSPAEFSLWKSLDKMPKETHSAFGLGRATLRGVRKCPKCGTSNGTRGLCCKNKSCDVIFKESGGRKKFSMEACRLDTGNSTRVYSVRVRDKGPDYRGFVQLPITQPSGMTIDESELINQSTALCFVEPCQRNFNNSILQCHVSCKSIKNW